MVAMAEGTPQSDVLHRLILEWTQRCLKVADEETVIAPEVMVTGFIDAAAVILATEWQGDVGTLKRAWEDAMRGFGLDMLLWAWAQRPDVRPNGKKES